MIKHRAKTVFIILFLLGLLSINATSATPRGLFVKVSPDHSFRMSSRDSGDGLHNVRIQFRGGKTLNGTYSREGNLLRYWISGVAERDQFLSASDKKNLRRFLDQKGSELRRQDALLASFIEMSANFFPTNERITPFEAKRFFNRRQFTSTSYTLICDLIGQESRAEYTVRGEPRTAFSLVGVEESECRGRCGMGCEQPGQYRYHQYTRECFNHDLCRLDTGSIMGECEDEFWDAAYGYAVAPECY